MKRHSNRRHATGIRHRHLRHASSHKRVHHFAKRAPARHSSAANSGSCPGADLRPTAEDLDRIRAATLCLINRERSGQGESPLSPNARLAQTAQAHSDDMAFGGYFEHVGPRGDTPLSRMRAAGYIYSSRVGYEVGENIAWGTLWLATPRSIVAAWMASPDHRANVLNARFRDTAIGVSARPLASHARGQAGAMYTEDFGVIITG